MQKQNKNIKVYLNHETNCLSENCLLFEYAGSIMKNYAYKFEANTKCLPGTRSFV